MKLQLSLFDLLIIIGMVTGIVCSILLFRKSKKKPSNMFLGLGILGFVWLNTKTLLLSLNLWEIHGIGFFPNGVELAIPPLFYFYLVSLIQPKFTFTIKNWVHFIPFILSQSFAIVVYYFTMQTSFFTDKQEVANLFYFNEVKVVEDYLLIFSSLFYMYFGSKLIIYYKQWLSDNTSDTIYSELSFLKNIFWGFILLCIYVICNLALNHYLDNSYIWRWQLNHLLIAILVYYMGLVGYKNAELFPKDYSIDHVKKTKKTNVIVDNSIIDALTNVFEKEKVYLNKKLNLQDLSKILNMSQTTLSNSINSHYNKNFRSLINELRVREVEKRLLDGALENLSLVGLANECGFNSEASFYRIFKATTGLTPKQYLETRS